MKKPIQYNQFNGEQGGTIAPDVPQTNASSQSAATAFYGEKEDSFVPAYYISAGIPDAEGLTYGQNLVRVKFSSSDEVSQTKMHYAAAIDQMNDIRSKTRDAEVRRWASVAITDLETACMYAVKALTA